MSKYMSENDLRAFATKWIQADQVKVEDFQVVLSFITWVESQEDK